MPPNVHRLPGLCPRMRTHIGTIVASQRRLSFRAIVYLFFFHYLLTRVLVFRFSSIQSGCDSLRLQSGRRWILQLDKRRHQTTIINSSLVLTAMGGFPYHLDLERCGSLSFHPLSELVYEILICRCVWHANLTYIQTCIMRVGVLPPASQWFD